ncbi:MIR motif [Trinorchestia longiramus]|nr:MIR motif [Trinorchestia longiramus]
MNFSDIFFIFLSVLGYVPTGTADQFVTCGSITKLYNSHYRVRLHSHDVKYGSGSGQQSVTGSPTQEDHNSNWLIKGTPNKLCSRGEPIKCGEEVRLEHVTTHRNLHSHHFSSPLSSQQEVSAFGEEGEGDTGDVWSVVCDGELWRRDDKVMLRHTDTDVGLSCPSHLVPMGTLSFRSRPPPLSDAAAVSRLHVNSTTPHVCCTPCLRFLSFVFKIKQNSLLFYRELFKIKNSS